MADEHNICPHCGRHPGPAGDLCPEAVCSRLGYHRVPEARLRAASEAASRRGRPLDPLLGRQIDKCLLCGLLGEGGMGAVYLAHQQPLGREVAVKLISGIELSAAAVGRFEREARAISALDHPNILRLYDYGVGGADMRVPYMVLEYVRQGRTLRRAFAAIREECGGVVPGDVVLSVFRQVLNALAAAHKAGIVHRDMKPDNVMLVRVEGSPHFVKVLDFGLAKAVAEVSGFEEDLSMTGQFLGTPQYMAPEQAGGAGQRGAADARSDIYAVAVMLFEVFTGVRPFNGDSALSILAQKVDPAWRPFDMPQARALPEPLRAFLRRGMAANPGDRFTTADETREALCDALAGEAPSAIGTIGRDGGSSRDRSPTPSATAPTQALGRTAHRPARWKPFAVAVAVLVAAGGTALAMWSAMGVAVPQATPETAVQAGPAPAALPAAQAPVVPVAEPAPAASIAPSPDAVVTRADRGQEPVRRQAPPRPRPARTIGGPARPPGTGEIPLL